MTKGFWGSLSRFFGSNLLLTATNIFRDIAIAATLGKSIAADHFFLAATLFVFIVTVAGNACRSSYVPILQDAIANMAGDHIHISRRLIYLGLQGVLLVFGALGILALLARLTAHAADLPAIAEISSALILLLPMYAMSTFVEINLGVLQVADRILIPNLTKSLMPIGIIASSLLMQQQTNITSIAIGGSVGALISLIWIIRSLANENYVAITTTPLPHVISTNLKKNLLSLTISSCIAYVAPVIDLWMAGFLGAGAASTLGYASRLTVGAGSLIIGSLTPVFLNILSQKLANNDRNGLNAIYNSFISLSPWVGTLMTLSIFILSGPLVEVFYQRGSLQKSDTTSIITAMDMYAFQFPYFLASAISVTTISALLKNHFFIIANSLLLPIKVIVNLALMLYMGVAGIALSTSINYLLSLFILNYLLKRDDHIALDRQCLKNALSSQIFMAVAIALIVKLDLKLTLASAATVYLQAGMVLLICLFAGAYLNRRFLFSITSLRR